MQTVTLATFPLTDRDEPYWQVHVGGIFAGERKDQVVALLKLAAGRL